MLSEAPTSASTINATKKRVRAEEPSVIEEESHKGGRRSRSKRRSSSKARDQTMKEEEPETHK